MATVKGANYKATVGKASNSSRNTANDLVQGIEIKKEIKSESIKDYETSATWCDSSFVKGVKTEPGALYHHGDRFLNHSKDPYSDDVIFMGITQPPNKSQFSFQTFNVTIKTEKKDYFETSEGVVIINDDSDEEADNNNNIKATDQNRNKEKITTEDKATENQTASNENSETQTRTVNSSSTSRMPSTLNEASNSLAKVSANKTASTAHLAAKNKLKQIRANSKAQCKPTDQHKPTGQAVQTKPAPNLSCEFNKIVLVHKNGRPLYLKYVKDPVYNKELILVYIKTDDGIRLFSKEFEPDYFYKAYYDWSTTPCYPTPSWIANLLEYYQNKTFLDIKEHQSYMNSFYFYPKMVQHDGNLLWKVARQQDISIIMQDLYNCEFIHICHQDNAEFIHLDHIFRNSPNSSGSINYSTYFATMKRHFFSKNMFWN